ncbi:uncharacterized protein LOC122154942 [Tyto alba]|uniref:uncharacterized protein LOC122154942 n=1 Tax=Tyto alba TaxID=56313 RepID=UPI001C6633ED|nr:uncharacterized protein LOC122154942 [Tyto alba]
MVQGFLLGSGSHRQDAGSSDRRCSLFVQGGSEKVQVVLAGMRGVCLGRRGFRRLFRRCRQDAGDSGWGAGVSYRVQGVQERFWDFCLGCRASRQAAGVLVGVLGVQTGLRHFCLWCGGSGWGEGHPDKLQWFWLVIRVPTQGSRGPGNVQGVLVGVQAVLLACWVFRHSSGCRGCVWGGGHLGNAQGFLLGCRDPRQGAGVLVVVQGAQRAFKGSRQGAGVLFGMQGAQTVCRGSCWCAGSSEMVPGVLVGVQGVWLGCREPRHGAGVLVGERKSQTGCREFRQVSGSSGRVVWGLVAMRVT